MKWHLYLDDWRFEDYTEEPFEGVVSVVCRTANDAIEQVKKRGLPEFMSLDYDLGDHNSFVFLDWLKENHKDTIPEYVVHSTHPRRTDVKAFLEEWEKELKL